MIRKVLVVAKKQGDDARSNDHSNEDNVRYVDSVGVSDDYKQGGKESRPTVALKTLRKL
jgi:hypothetical protein